MIYANGGKVLLLNGWLLSSFGGVPGYQGRWKSKEPLSQGSFFKEILCPTFFLIYICKIQEGDQIFPLSNPITPNLFMQNREVEWV